MHASDDVVALFGMVCTCSMVCCVEPRPNFGMTWGIHVSVFGLMKARHLVVMCVECMSSMLLCSEMEKSSKDVKATIQMCHQLNAM